MCVIIVTYNLYMQSNNSSFTGHENASYSLMQSNNSSFPGHENASYSLTLDVEAGKIHVVSWMDCLDLRLFAVLINSTISSSRSPERVHFHFFIPEGQEKKLSYYKLKVLFPDSNLEMIGQKEVKEKLRVSFDGRHLWSSLLGIKPFIISTVYPNLSKFIYVTPDVIMKGRVEELFKIDLETHAIAAVEDCSKRLSSSVNFNVLDAVQRSADKPWVSRSPYKRDACVPDMRVLLINANNLAGGKIVQAVQWWDNVLNGGNDRSEETSPAILLTLYNKYLKLDSGWNVTAEFAPSGHEDNAKILHFDGPKRVCSEADSKPAQETHYGNLWRQYMPPSSDRILGD
ncbi:probable galacturonosyltransferase 6 [Amborella trichopoda]|uniref:probable galacturonosyltransferase 6 n=1 Tax=Amborella trichopoda TaxID=13333 RepID=UPI0009BEC6B2|nr:probable galacturonosyltransferase 6 [Amborella trichopoda]|eukprot:XP_011626623.2 probable galacturonosyltransferase 6 [Amborella trichopoda]